MDEKILAAARRVCEIQSEYDGADHDTTTVTFMADNGVQWLARRDAVMGKIDVRRTEAIWALSRLLV